jgi:hypothetical protein
LFNAAGQTFEGFVRNDEGTGWLLVGRGRNGWEFDLDGQGALAAAGNEGTLGTTAAFEPALYSDAIVNDLIANSGVDLTEVEIRIRRAGDVAGTGPYQEARWRPITQTTWTGDFDGTNPGYAVVQEILSGPGSPHGPVDTNTRDTFGPSGNNHERIFTWAWGGHGNQQGFSYGQTVLGVDGNDATTFLWESGAENHALPYTEVYIRLLNPVPPPESFKLAVGQDGATLVLNWDSKAGMLYKLWSSTDLAADPATWDLVEGDIPATPPSNMKTFARPGDSARFYQVEEYPAPPVTVFSENFDGVDPGWSAGFNAADTRMNSVWQLGDPTGGPFSGPAAAQSGLNCYGTNLTANYGTSSSTWLRTPAIDLSTATAATVTFQQWVDMDEFDNLDRGTVRILDASVLPGTVTELGVVQANITGLDPAGWVEFAMDVPAAALGHSIAVEFLFESDADDIFDQSGWYIDSVLVTTPAP